MRKGSVTNYDVDRLASAPTHPPHRVAYLSLRKSIHLLVTSCIFGQVWSGVAAGVALTQLGKLLGMTPFGFGLLNGLVPYGQFAQLLGSFLVERHGHRKWIVIIGGLIHRILWVFIAFLPLFGASTATWGLLIGLAALSYFVAYATTPACTSWFSALIPGRLQGRFYGRRSQVGLIASLIIMFLVGFILDKAQYTGPTVLKHTLIILFAASGILGMIEHLLYIPVPDPPTHTPKPTVSLWTLIRKPLADREFLCFLGFYGTITCSSFLIGQFMTLFFLDILRWSNLQLILLSSVAFTVISIFVCPFWGRIVDRTGYKPVFIIGGLSYCAVAVWPILASSSHWIGPYILSLFICIFAPALDSGAAVFMYTKVSGQGNQGFGSAFPAVYGIGIALAGTLSAVAGGAVAQWVGTTWRGAILGHPLTYHSVIFLIVLGIRLMGLVWLIGFNNPKDYSLRRTLNTVGEQLIFDTTRLGNSIKTILFRQEKGS